MSGGGGDSGEIKETEAQKAESRVFVDQWNKFAEISGPSRAEYDKRVSALNTDAAKEFAAGTAAQKTTAAYSEAREQAKQGLAASGANPNSGKWRSTQTEINVDQGISSGTRQGDASNSKTGDYVQGLSNQIAIGEGEKTTALTGFSGLSDLSQQEAAQDASISLQKQQTKQSVVGSAIGGGLATYEHYGKPKVDVDLNKTQTGLSPQSNTGPRTVNTFGTNAFAN